MHCSRTVLFLTIYPQERKILSQFEQGCFRWNLWCLTGGNEDFQPADEKVRTVLENQICRQWPKSGLQSVGRLKVQPFPRFLHGQFIHTSICKYSWVCLNLNLVSCWASETPAPGLEEHDPKQLLPMSTTSSGSRQLFLGQKESLLLLWEWLPQQNQFNPGGDGSCLKLRWWWVRGCGMWWVCGCLVSEVRLLSLSLWGELLWSAALLSPSGHYSLPTKLEMWAGRGGDGCCSRPLRPPPSSPMHTCVSSAQGTQAAAVGLRLSISKSFTSLSLQPLAFAVPARPGQTCLHQRFLSCCFPLFSTARWLCRQRAVKADIVGACTAQGGLCLSGLLLTGWQCGGSPRPTLTGTWLGTPGQLHPLGDLRRKILKSHFIPLLLFQACLKDIYI